MELSLQVRPPFSLAAVIRSHGWIRLAPFMEDEAADAIGSNSVVGFRTILQTASGRVVNLHVTEAEGGVCLQTDANLNNSEAADIADRVSWMLGMEQDFSSFYALCRNEPKLAHVEDAAQGRLLRSPTLFEDFVKTILTTNTAWSGTIRMTEALVSTYGTSLDSDSTAHAFPTPSRLAQSNESELRELAKLGYRSPFILELAQRIDSGDLDLETFKTDVAPTSEIRKRLLGIKGVGGYASANLLMLLGRYDYLPVDSWARKMVSQEWYDGQLVGADEVEAAFADWGEWKGLVYWFWNWEEAT